MKKLALSVHQYRVALHSDSEIVKQFPDESERDLAIETMVQRYADSRQKEKAERIAWIRSAPERQKKEKIKKAKDKLRNSLIERFGFADEVYISRIVDGMTIDFNPFTDDPNCKSCQKKKFQ